MRRVRVPPPDLQPRLAVALATALTDTMVRMAGPLPNALAMELFHTIFATPSWVGSGAIAVDAKVVPSTLTSTFHRAGLPKLKAVVLDLRLAGVAGTTYFAPRITLAAIADMWCYSSQQSLNRHVRHERQVTARAFLHNDPLQVHKELERFVRVHIQPHAEAWATFDNHFIRTALAARSGSLTP